MTAAAEDFDVLGRVVAGIAVAVVAIGAGGTTPSARPERKAAPGPRALRPQRGGVTLPRRMIGTPEIRHDERA
jgi:hypothetical protein